MNDDLTTLASAYLDGDVSAEERATVERDEALLVEVERLRAVRAVLSDIDPTPISVRERHIAAALDAWDRLPGAERAGARRDMTPSGVDAAAIAGAATVTAPFPLTARRRTRTSGRLLAVAAALTVVVGGGLVTRAVLTGGSDDSATADIAAPTIPDAPTARENLDVQAADETFGGSAELELEAPAAAEDGAGSQSDTFIGSDEAPPDDELEVLRSNEDLAVFANDLLTFSAVPAESTDDEPAAGAAAVEDSASDPFPSCDLVDRIVGPALWDIDGLFDQLVVVGIDDSSRDAVAYDPATCAIVARTALLDG